MSEMQARDNFSLGPLERAVMEALWAHGSLSPREAHDVVGRPRNLAYTTILTIVQRLHAKGLLERSEYGRTHRYEPLMSRDDYGARQAQHLAETLVRIGDSGVAAFLSETRRLDPSVVEALRRNLENLE
jgi:predicted transcriptional regulator